MQELSREEGWVFDTYSTVILIYYTVCTGKYHESVAVLSRVPQARVTIRLQTSDVSLYTLYFIMFPYPTARRVDNSVMASTRLMRLTTSGIATVDASN